MSQRIIRREATLRIPIDLALPDQRGSIYRLSEHLDGAVVVVFNRGDW